MKGDFIANVAATLRRHPFADSTMACKPTTTLIPSNVTYSSPSRAISAMNLLSPVADCNISVSSNKWLRQSGNARYNRGVENSVQAPIAAPIFLPSPHQILGERNHLFESNSPLNLSLSASSTLLKTTLPQLAHFQSLPHSLKNNPGYGLVRLTPAFPFWERRPVAAIAPQIAGLSPRSCRERPTETYLPPDLGATPDELSAARASARILPGARKNEPGILSRFSLAIKKQSTPNLPPIAGNERKANDVYKVFRNTVLSFRRIDR
jgi:hypothetical protein